MGFFKRLFGIKDKEVQQKTTSCEDKVVAECSMPIKINGKEWKIPIRLTEKMIEESDRRENDSTILEESQLQIKSVRRVDVNPNLPKCILHSCFILIHVDGKDYEIKASLKEEEIENFEDYRRRKKFYSRLPNENEVAIPCSASYSFFAGNKDVRKKVDTESLKFANLGCMFVPISKTDFFKCVEHQQKILEEEKLLQRTAELNNKGIKLEKEGKIDEAIAVYEENVKLGYPAHHSYDRLIILYHKQKDFSNEERAIRLKLEKFGDNEKLRARLDKLIVKYGKSKNRK